MSNTNTMPTQYNTFRFLTTIKGRAEWVAVVACDFESACADFDQAGFEETPAKDLPSTFRSGSK